MAVTLFASCYQLFLRKFSTFRICPKHNHWLISNCEATMIGTCRNKFHIAFFIITNNMSLFVQLNTLSLNNVTELFTVFVNMNRSTFTGCKNSKAYLKFRRCTILISFVNAAKYFSTRTKGSFCSIFFNILIAKRRIAQLDSFCLSLPGTA